MGSRGTSALDEDGNVIEPAVSKNDETEETEENNEEQNTENNEE